MEITKEIKELVDEAKEIGRMQIEVELADVTFHAYHTLKIFCTIVTHMDLHSDVIIPANNLWNAIHKINPDLEIPVYLEREAKMKEQSNG